MSGDSNQLLIEKIEKLEKENAELKKVIKDFQEQNPPKKEKVEGVKERVFKMWVPKKEMMMDFLLKYPKIHVYQRRIRAMVIVSLFSLSKPYCLFELKNQATFIAYNQVKHEIHIRVQYKGHYNHYFIICPNRVNPQHCFVQDILEYMKDIKNIKKKNEKDDYFWKSISAAKDKSKQHLNYDRLKVSGAQKSVRLELLPFWRTFPYKKLIPLTREELGKEDVDDLTFQSFKKFSKKLLTYDLSVNLSYIKEQKDWKIDESFNNLDFMYDKNQQETSRVISRAYNGWINNFIENQESFDLSETELEQFEALESEENVVDLKKVKEENQVSKVRKFKSLDETEEMEKKKVKIEKD